MAMGGQGNTTGRLHPYGLLDVSTLALLAACDWFDGSAPARRPPRPGPSGASAAPRSTLPTARVAVAHASQDVNGPSAEADSERAHGTNAARGVAANRRAEVLIDL